jgi:hypothetical protein
MGKGRMRHEQEDNDDRTQTPYGGRPATPGARAQDPAVLGRGRQAAGPILPALT